MKITRVRSDYDASRVDIGIVHLGLGAFHRAHQAMYLEKNLQRHNGGNWGICAANIRSNYALVDKLTAAGCHYHIAEYESKQAATWREIFSIREVIFAGVSRDELLDRLCDPSVRIVTLTVTEKGYGIAPATGALRQDDPAIRTDLVSAQGVASVPGLLVTALDRRRLEGSKAFTILSCDNMPHNGKRVRGAVLEMANARDSELADWIAINVTFPSSMVDRIVPAVTDQARQQMQQHFAEGDANAIATEAFSQWVIEDQFCDGRPDLEQDGVQFVEDVAPYETMKLRLLNGSHSLLAYLGLLTGQVTVDQAVSQPELNSMLRRYMSETCSSIEVDSNLNQYCNQLIARFANDTLAHELAQIATDGSQKIPQRWLAHLVEQLDENKALPATEQALAAWIQFMSGSGVTAALMPVNDPLSALFSACAGCEDPFEAVSACLQQTEVFPQELAKAEPLKQRLAKYLTQIKQCCTEEELMGQIEQWNAVLY